MSPRSRVLLLGALALAGILAAGCCGAAPPDARKDAALLEEVGSCVSLMGAWAPEAYRARAKTLGDNTNADLRARLAPK